MASASRAKLKELNLKEKCELLRFLENHSERQAAAHFGISKTTVNNIKRRRPEYWDRFEKESEKTYRKRRATEFEEVNELTADWYRRMKGFDEKISGPMIQENARKFAEKLQLPHFKASNGWLACFKHRNGISSKMLAGDSSEVCQTLAEDFPANFGEFSSGFAMEDIFNADECALVYKAVPDRSTGATCKAEKMSKEHLTVLLAASASGEKLEPLVIGKSRNPRSFKHVEIQELPALWRANKAARMTPGLFIEWLNIVNQKMQSQKRHILMVVDNCPAHPKVTNLSNVTLKFLPSNSPSFLQPLDQGVTKCFEAFYRKSLLSDIASKCDSHSGQSVSAFAAKINVLEAVMWISSAWNKVKEDTIVRCFKKAGFTNEVESLGSELEDLNNEADFPHLRGFDMANFVDIGKGMATSHVSAPADVFEETFEEFKSKSGAATESDEEDDDYVKIEGQMDIATPKEMLGWLDKISQYAANNCTKLLLPVFQSKEILSEIICQSQIKCE